MVDNAFMYGHVYTKDSTSKAGQGVKKLTDYLKTRDDLFRVGLTPLYVFNQLIAKRTGPYAFVS